MECIEEQIKNLMKKELMPFPNKQDKLEYTEEDVILISSLFAKQAVHQALAEADKKEYSIINNYQTMNITPVPVSIVIYSVENEKIGEFKELNGKLTFEGNIDESAKLFSDKVCEIFNERIKTIREEAFDGIDFEEVK